MLLFAPNAPSIPLFAPAAFGIAAGWIGSAP
jgi:hypothetical protein